MYIMAFISVRPTVTRIMPKRSMVSAGNKYEVECTTSGSRPAAVVTWWRNGKFLGRTDSKVVDNGNTTVSVLRLKPTARDNGKTVICRAENTDIPDSALEDEWKLHVQCKCLI